MISTKTLYAYKDCMIAINPGTEQVRSKDIVVCPWPDTLDVSGDFHATFGACFLETRKWREGKIVEYLQWLAWYLTLEYDCDARSVHNALMNIKEYNAAHSRSIPLM